MISFIFIYYKMSELKEHILNWLIELEEEKSIILFKNCEIRNFYIDTLFEINSDFEKHLHKVIIDVPLKIYKNLQNYKHEIWIIESAIIESWESHWIFIKDIEWSPYLKNELEKENDEKSKTITQLFSQEYVNKQIKLMNNSIENNPHIALGISKELIETCCKYILNQAGVKVDKTWDIAKLVKITNKQIDLMPFEVDNSELAKTSVAKILSWFWTIVHWITELRNSYWTWHWHDPEFKELDEIYIKLSVSASKELVIFYLNLQKIKNKNH